MSLSDHLHKLGYFVKVAEAGTIKEGSFRAHLSQPQMTKVVQQLEDIVGQELFVRSKTGVKTTKAGDMLYQHAISILKATTELEVQIKSIGSAPVGGEVSIGTYDSICRYFFPDFLKYMHQAYPNFKIHLQTGKSRDVAKLIKKGEVDLGVIVNASDYPGLSYEVIYEDSFGLYISPMMGKRLKNKLIYFNFSLNEIEKSAKNFGFVDSISCDNLETVKSLVEEGMGVGLLPHRVAREGALQGKLIPFQHAKIKKNYFDEHNIDLCSNTKLKDEAVIFLKSELKRFLDVWSKI